MAYAEDKSTQENIFVVVDPTRGEHPALNRAVIAADTHASPPNIHLFISVDQSAKDFSSSDTVSGISLDELNGLLEPLREKSISCTAEVCWSPQWQEAIVASAKRFEADMILVTDYAAGEGNGVEKRPSLRRSLTDAKWALLRNAACPVLIIRPGTEAQRKNILAAVNMQSGDSRYDALNTKIISRGQWLADLYNAQFHVVNAYSDSMHYPDRGQILREVNLGPEQVHIKQGNPEDVISEVAANVDADIVVIGTMARKGVLGAMRGNTSEKVLNKLTGDVMTLN